MDDNKDLRLRIIRAGYKAVEELIKVAEEPIITDENPFASEGDGALAADRLKNAAQAKKLAIFDALEILSKIENEQTTLGELGEVSDVDNKQGFAERRAGSGGRSV